MKVRIFIGLINVLLMSSCSIYKPHFDCPPGVGVGCKSVSEIEAMITEEETGEDSFKTCVNCKKNEVTKKQFIGGKKRVWLEDCSFGDNQRVDGHYIYFNLGE